jgi:DNA-binding response OmpR family regulator
VRQIHEHCRRTAIVLITGWSTPELIVEAKCAGATGYAAKPLVGDELLGVVDQALHSSAIARTGEAALTSYSARRWVDLVVRGVYLADDPKTVRAWCRAVGVARGTLQKRCDAVGVTPKNSLDFVRLLRVMIQHTGQPWDLQRWLDIADDRTVRALLQRAGWGTDRRLVPDLERFLSHQQLIRRSDLVDPVRLRLPRGLAR